MVESETSYLDNLDTYTQQKVELIRGLAKSGNTPMLVGPPGVGKSALIRSIGENENLEVITLVGSRMDPTDVSGLPFAQQETVEVNEDGKITTRSISVTEFLTPAWQARILRNPKTILFIDEFSNTSPAVQASMLTILQEREFPNGVKIPDETYIIGAMNPSDSAVDYGGISKPTANRLSWIAWNPTAESWYIGMLNAWNKEVSDDEMKWRKAIVAFVKSNPKFIHREPDDVVKNDGDSKFSSYIQEDNSSEMAVFENAYPTRRTWDKLARALSFTNDSTVQHDMMVSLVGHEAATAFAEYIQKQVKVNVEEVIKDPSIVDWKEVSPDDANVIIRSLVEKINDKMDYSRLDSILGVFDYIAVNEERADLAAHSLTSIVGKAPKQEKCKTRLVKTIRNYNSVAGHKKKAARPSA